MKPKHLLVAFLLPLSVIAAACSDDDSASSEGSDDTEENADAPSEEEIEESAEAGEAEAANDEAEMDQGDSTVPPGDAMGTPPSGDTADYNIAEIAAGTGDVSTLTRLVITAGLLPTVRDGGPFTVFAPTNQAFAAVPEDTMAALRADRLVQADIILQHVVPGTLTTDDLKAMNGTSLETANGQKLLVEVDGDNIKVGGATIVLPDVAASNGMIQVVDAVIATPNG
jgi:uncharacterized surface protein with fasciclin (FAS1) repeats